MRGRGRHIATNPEPIYLKFGTVDYVMGHTSADSMKIAQRVNCISTRGEVVNYIVIFLGVIVSGALCACNRHTAPSATAY